MKRKIPQANTGQGYPPLDNNPNGPAGWDLIQLAIQENDASILKFLTQDDNTKVYILTGTLTISGGNYSYTGGFVYYQGDAGNSDGIKMGEIFYVPKVNTTTMGGNTFLNATVTPNPSGSDPITYIGGGIYSPHLYRTITLTPATAASVGHYSLPANCQAASLPYQLIDTLPDATLWQALNKPLITIVPATGSGPSYAFRAGYSQLNRLAFWKDCFGLVHLQGDFTSAGTDGTGYLFTLPAGYIPASTVYGIIMTTGSNYATYKENVAYFATIDNTGRVSAGYSMPSDAGNYSIIFQPFTTQ